MPTRFLLMLSTSSVISGAMFHECIPRNRLAWGWWSTRNSWAKVQQWFKKASEVWNLIRRVLNRRDGYAISGRVGEIPAVTRCRWGIAMPRFTIGGSTPED